jgi:hypothetical protein
MSRSITQSLAPHRWRHRPPASRAPLPGPAAAAVIAADGLRPRAPAPSRPLPAPPGRPRRARRERACLPRTRGISTARTGGGKYVPDDIGFPTPCPGGPPGPSRPSRCSPHRPRRHRRSPLTPSHPCHTSCSGLATGLPSRPDMLTGPLPGQRPGRPGNHAPDEPAPFAPPPLTGTSPLLRAGPPARAATVPGAARFLPLAALPPAAAPSRAQRQHAPFPRSRTPAADPARATGTPGTAWPVDGHPPGSSRDRHCGHGSDAVSLSRRLSGGSLASAFPAPARGSHAAFSASLTTTVFSQPSMRRLGPPRRAAPKGHETCILQPASTSRHRLLQRRLLTAHPAQHAAQL